MRLVFATTQTLLGSTVIGRIAPLAFELAQNHETHLLVLNSSAPVPSDLRHAEIHYVGNEPFMRTAGGKQRHSGLRVIANMLGTALRTAGVLLRLRPDVIIVVKTLPANVLGVRLARLFLPSVRIIVDVDDFELTANHLSSFLQRAAVHASERTAVGMATALVAATPFLADHLQQLTGGKKTPVLIPTGYTPQNIPLDVTAQKSAHILLYIGSISIASGHRVDLLPEILAAVHIQQPHLRLRIAGGGDDIETLKQQFAAKGLTEMVEWTGRFSVDALMPLLRDVAVLIDPVDASIAQRAKSSFRVSLAAATGTPVVSSNVGVRPYLLPRNLHARLFAEPADPASYAAAVQSLLMQPLSAEDRETMRHHARQYRWDALSRQYSLCLQ